jgi:hypothetical protein
MSPPLKHKCSYAQPRTSTDSPVTLLPDGHSTNHRGLAHPTFRGNHSFCSIIRRIVHGIYGVTSRKAKAHQREKLHQFHPTPVAPSAPRYGCATVRIDQEFFDVPTLAHKSGLRTVMQGFSLSLKNSNMIISCSSGNVNWMSFSGRLTQHLRLDWGLDWKIFCQNLEFLVRSQSFVTRQQPTDQVIVVSHVPLTTITSFLRLFPSEISLAGQL